MKTIKVFLAIMIMMISLYVRVDAVESDNLSTINGIKITSEPQMPRIDTSQSIDLEDVELERLQWIADIIDYNEEFYNQNVSEVIETNDSYVLLFNKANIEEAFVSNASATVSYINSEYWGVEKIEYFKPESFQIVGTNGTNASIDSIYINGEFYDYKFTYYYSITTNSFVETKTFASYVSIASNVLQKIAPTRYKRVLEIISDLCDGVLSIFDHYKPISTTTMLRYYYENKVCSVKHTNGSYWYPTCQIGRRCGFNTYLMQLQNDLGDWVPTLENVHEITSLPPTNYDFQDKKDHFDDNTWMITTAVEYMQTGGYVDVYAICYNERD